MLCAANNVAAGNLSIIIVTLANYWRQVMPEMTAEDWQKQIKLREQWLLDNPDAEYIGWTSI